MKQVHELLTTSDLKLILYLLQSVSNIAISLVYRNAISARTAPFLSYNDTLAYSQCKSLLHLQVGNQQSGYKIWIGFLFCANFFKMDEFTDFESFDVPFSLTKVEDLVKMLKDLVRSISGIMASSYQKAYLGKIV